MGNSYSYTSTEKVYDSGVYQGEAGVEFATDVLGYEDVTLSSPANINGTSVSSFPSCLKLSQTVTVDGDVVGPETQWYARDLGFVKISNGSGTYELTSATTYYDTAFWDTWRGRLYDSSGTYRGTMTLVLERDGSDLMGTVQLWLSDGSGYILPLVSGAPNSYASGPNAVGHATDGSNTFDFALTHNGSNLTGPFNSSFLGHGTVGPPSSGGGGGGGGGGGCSLAARPVSAGDALGWAVPYAVLFAAYLWARFMRRSGKDGHRRPRERWSGAKAPAWTAMFLLCAVLAIFGCGGGGGGGGSGGGGGGSGKPDLVDSGDALDQLVPSNLIGIGDYFQALCMIGNNGTAAAGTFYVDLYASTNSTITTSDCFLARAQVSSMPAGGSDVIVIDVPSFPSIPQGDYYIGFIIDPTNAVNESDTSNNVGLCTNGVLTVTSLTQLINGVPMNGAVAYGAWKYYYIDVTATTKPFTVQTTNATGDIDLYLHKGTMPTWTDYQFSAETGSGNEIITVNGGNFLLLSSGRWYIGVVGYANAGYTIAAAVGGSAVPVLVVSDGFRPHFSPDGTKIVFTRLSTAAEDSASNIWCINVDGTGLTRLTNNTTNSDFSPQWNPNGQRISFLRKAGTILSSNAGFLYDMASDGTDVVLRDPFSSLEDFCHWKQSSTSTEIVSIRTNGEVWLSMGWPNIWGQALRRSGGAHNIRSSADPAATSPAPDVAMNDTTARKIVRFNPSGLSEATLQASYDFPCPCPSPSGSKIAAGTDGGLPWGLYVMNSSDGSGLMPLTTGIDQQPTWYGNTIVFVRASGGGSLRHGDIYKIDVSGFVAGSTAPAVQSAQVRYVPSSDHETIQAAVNASADGDKVVVAPGEYRGNLVFGGKAVTVESSDGPEQTILKPLDEKLPTVAFTAGEGPGAVLRGFTVMGGESGILVRGARPTLRGNELLCGLDCDSSLATVLTRAGNSLDAKGAGILGGLAGLDPGQLVAWVAAEPRAMFAELRRMAGKPRATAARPAVIAAASLPAISPRQGHETWLLLLGLFSLVAAMVLVAELLRRKGLARKRAWAGFPARPQPCDGGTRDKTTRRGSPAL